MITENLISREDYRWFDLEAPSPADFEKLRTEFGLPALLIQDTLRPEHLPKYEFSEDAHFLMLRSFDQRSTHEATVQELTRKTVLYITSREVITIHRVELEYIQNLIQRFKKSDAPRSLQTLVYQIILSAIRTYEEPINKLQDDYDDFEIDILSKKIDQLETSKVYQFRRQLYVIKRVLKQTNDALFRSKGFWDEDPSMLQDLKENIDQLYFRLDEITNNFEHLFQLHISLNNQKANEAMKFLAVFSTILLPLNFLASFYGMNFTQIPGLESTQALVAVVAVMIALILGGIWYFKHKGWFRTPEE